MLQAMNTGHEGSMTTIHANSPRDALARLEQMVAMAGMNMSEASVRTHIASALDVVIQLERLSDGTRRVVSVSEITGLEGHAIQMQEIFSFERIGVDSEGKVAGNFSATGIRPYFADSIRLRGASLPDNLFEPTLGS
jgi:pilus assembly protein CpaF